MSEPTHQIMNVRDCRTCPFLGRPSVGYAEGEHCTSAGRPLDPMRVVDGLLPAWCPLANAPVLVRLDSDRRS